MSSTQFDVFADLTIGGDPPPLYLFDPAAHVTTARDGGKPAHTVLRAAIARAAARRRHLLIVTGAIVLDRTVLNALIDAFERDPMLGSSQPRFGDMSGIMAWPLPGAVQHPIAAPTSSCGALSFLPDLTITPELPAACMMLRSSVLCALEDIDGCYSSLAGALHHLLREARRRGYRNAVLNHALLRSDLTYDSVYPRPSSHELEHLRATNPDSAWAAAEIDGLPQRQLEPLLSAAQPTSGPLRLLLDCRGMPPRHNGSAQAILGFLDGFSALDHDFAIDLVVAPEPAEFHQLARRYPCFGQIGPEPSGHYFAAVSLTQPWHLSTIADLHRHALVVAVSMLDTIAWDVVYPAGTQNLGTVWRFIARFADGLLYISEYSRQRFNVRFPVAPGVAERVTHLSLARDDHIGAGADRERINDHILVFGNEYDHKYVRPTVALLADAFPFDQIVGVGADGDPPANVKLLPSGKLSREELHGLMAGARVIVYPSFYEGFGLPVVEGLAYGRPVVVRKSALWSEIAGWSRLPGALIEYEDTPSLIDAVGRLLHGAAVNALPSGAHLNGDDAAPPNWCQCAARVISLLKECASRADGRRWIEREETLRLAGL